MTAEPLRFESSWTFEDLLGQLTDDLERLGATAPPSDFETLARALVACRGFRQLAADIERLLESRVAAAMERPFVTIEGLGTLERKKSKDRKAWDHKRVAAKLLEVAKAERIDGLTGEVLASEGEAAMLTFLACAGVAYWKTTELRGRGIDPDDYCESSPGRETVRVIT